MIEILKEQLKELTFLMEKLDEVLPDKEIKYEHDLYEDKKRIPLPKIDPVASREEPKQEIKREPERPKDNTAADMHRLEQALSSIEKKLGKL